MKKVGHIIRESVSQNIKDRIGKRSNLFLISYTRVSSAKMDNFRKILRRAGANVYVSRNSIARRTLKDLNFEQLAEKINGQTAFVWSDKDSVEVSKALVKFAKDCDGVVVQGGLLDGNFLANTDVQRLSDLPSREILLTMLLGTLQSPLVKLVGVLNGKTMELIYLLKQLSEQKGGK